MAVFDEVWGMASGTMKKRQSSVAGARRELFVAMCLSPLFFTSLGAGVAPCITASDASGTGGAWAISSSLTSEGENFVDAIHLLEEEGDTAPILVISLFNGIGGAFRCYDVAGIPVAWRISFDLSKEANRVTSKAWPSTMIYTDVKNITPKLVEEWLLKFTTIEEVHIWAGFPCVDLSSVKAGRLNLEGSQSRLFYEIPRVVQLCKEGFGRHVVVKSLVENVASMDEKAAKGSQRCWVRCRTGWTQQMRSPCTGLDMLGAPSLWKKRLLAFPWKLGVTGKKFRLVRNTPQLPLGSKMVLNGRVKIGVLFFPLV